MHPIRTAVVVAPQGRAPPHRRWLPQTVSAKPDRPIHFKVRAHNNQTERRRWVGTKRIYLGASRGRDVNQ